MCALSAESHIFLTHKKQVSKLVSHRKLQITFQLAECTERFEV